MITKPCPDCTTGWRYSDEVPNVHRHSAPVSLVKCPTCEGTGRLVEATQDRLPAFTRDLEDCAYLTT